MPTDETSPALREAMELLIHAIGEEAPDPEEVPNFSRLDNRAENYGSEWRGIAIGLAARVDTQAAELKELGNQLQIARDELGCKRAAEDVSMGAAVDRILAEAGENYFTACAKTGEETWTVTAQREGGISPTDTIDQLRAELKTLREELEAAEAEIAKRDELQITAAAAFVTLSEMGETDPSWYTSGLQLTCDGSEAVLGSTCPGCPDCREEKSDG